MTELEKIRFCNEMKLKRMQWGIRRYQNDDGTLTKEAKARYLTDEQIATINSGVEKLAKENGLIMQQTRGLADWQIEIMEQNED